MSLRIIRLVLIGMIDHSILDDRRYIERLRRARDLSYRRRDPQVELRWVCRRASRIPFVVDLYSSSAIRVRLVSASKIVQVLQSRRETRSEEKGGLLLVGCSECAHGEGSLSAGGVRSQLDYAGHEPERSMFGVNE